MTDYIELELHCNGEFVAAASGPKDRAIAEMHHYALQYSDEGPLVVYRVERHAFNLASGADILARAEAKAKEPQCKCAMRHKEDGHMICGGFEPHAKYPDFCCATLSSGDVCAHDRACHSSAVEG